MAPVSSEPKNCDSWWACCVVMKIQRAESSCCSDTPLEIRQTLSCRLSSACICKEHCSSIDGPLLKKISRHVCMSFMRMMKSAPCDCVFTLVSILLVNCQHSLFQLHLGHRPWSATRRKIPRIGDARGYVGHAGGRSRRGRRAYACGHDEKLDVRWCMRRERRMNDRLSWMFLLILFFRGLVHGMMSSG